MKGVCIHISRMLTKKTSTLRLQFWRQGKGDYFQGIMFMAELSTPSVCLGKILIQVSLSVGTGRARAPSVSHASEFSRALFTSLSPPSTRWEMSAFFPSVLSMQLVHARRPLFTRPAPSQTSFIGKTV